MAISASDVKRLREQTGAGMMDCKKALGEVNGDFDAAVDFLRKKGLAAAAKKATRVAAEGLVGAHIDGKYGVLVEVNCETDFVAKNDDFQKFVGDISKVILANKPGSLEELKAATMDGGATVEATVNELTLKIGEKIDPRRFEIAELSGNGALGSYVHSGKIGVIVEVEAANAGTEGNADFQELVKDLCMHVTAADPKFVTADEIDEDFKNKEAEIYTAQLKDQGKPENMIPNIVKGKLNKLASEVCLVEQKFVKNPDLTIKKLLEEVSAKVGDTLSIKRFVKVNLGEGIEKREDNLADEVAKMTGKN